MRTSAYHRRDYLVKCQQCWRWETLPDSLTPGIDFFAYCSKTGCSARRNCAFCRHSKPCTSWSLWLSFGFALLICLCDFCTIKNTTCSFFAVLSSSWCTSRISKVTSMSKKSLATASMIPAAEGYLRVRGGNRQLWQQKTQNNQVLQLWTNISEFTKPRLCIKTGSLWQMKRLKRNNLKAETYRTRY